jgi:hypothetical protein
MKNRIFVIIAVIVAVFAIVSVSVFLVNRTQTATSYEAADGWVYRCSKPIEVKYQGATYGNGRPSLTPVNTSEAAKYCQKIGIE